MYLSSFILHIYYNIFFVKNQERFLGENNASLVLLNKPLGGDSGTRTHTTSRSSDFESDTSTNSIISPNKTHFRGLQPRTAASLAILILPAMNQLNTPCIFTAPFRAVPVAVRPYRSVSGHSHNRLSSFGVQFIVPTHSKLKDKNTTKGLNFNKELSYIYIG